MATEEQLTGESSLPLGGAGVRRGGQILTVSARVITKLSFKLKRGALTSSSVVTYEIRDPNDSYSLIQAKTAMSQSALTETATLYEYTLATPQYLNQEIWIGINYNDQGASKQVYLAYNAGNLKDNEHQATESYAGIWVVARDQNRVVCSLDTTEGRFIGENWLIMDPRVPLLEQEREAQRAGQESGHPFWATPDGGVLLAQAQHY